MVAPRREAVTMNDGPVPVRDGYFALTLSRALFWRKAMTVLGLPDLADDKELQPPGVRQKHRRPLHGKRVEAAMAEWTRAELFEALAAERVVAGPAYRIDEMGENPQLVARGFFRTMPGSATRFPGPFARMTVSPWRLRHEMPDVAADDATFRRDGFGTRRLFEREPTGRARSRFPGPRAHPGLGGDVCYGATRPARRGCHPA